MKRTWQTRLIHTETTVPLGFRSLATPTYRGSTIVFPTADQMSDHWDQQERDGYTYGLYGTPTTLELAARICELESGRRTLITPGGQGAISLINLALLKAGDHVLIPSNIYKPHSRLINELLSRFGVTVTHYGPCIGGEIAQLFRNNTRLVWTESPGSYTMEVQDVPSICAVAHDRNIKVALDNTWSAGVFFRAFDHGVDISMQALTKYVGGHSDVLLGAVSVRDEEIFENLGAAHQLLGFSASPDDCSLAIRGVKTLAVRLAAIETSALTIAKWLGERPEVDRVLHPALPSCPGHEFWKRDFLGSSGVFSIIFRADIPEEKITSFVNALKLFKIGWSWGGVSSLAVPHYLNVASNHNPPKELLVRLSIGLESPDDLIADLQEALAS